MKAYQKPLLTILIPGTLSLKLQGTGASLVPDCSSDSETCGNFTGDLGSVCTLNQGSEEGRTVFFLPGSNHNETPSCRMILNNTEPAGNCVLSPVDGADCGEGAVWELRCAYPDNTCIFIFSGPSANTFEISCEGFENVSCDTLPAPN